MGLIQPGPILTSPSPLLVLAVVLGMAKMFVAVHLNAIFYAEFQLATFLRVLQILLHAVASCRCLIDSIASAK